MRRAHDPARLPAKKIALLHVARRDLGLTDDDYRAILTRFGGVASASELNLVGFERVIGELTRLGFHSTWSRRTFGHRAGMASTSQVELIRKLWAEYRGKPDEPGLNVWLERFYKVSALRFVDASTAAKVLPALKAMAARTQNGR